MIPCFFKKDTLFFSKKIPLSFQKRYLCLLKKDTFIFSKNGCYYTRVSTKFS